MREHRQFDRTAAIIKVNYSTHGALRMDYAQNISRGGLFLASNSSFEMGQDIELQLNTSGLKKPIGIPGKVRWIGERGTPPVRGIGVQFLLDDPAVKEHIERMIEAAGEPEGTLARRKGEISIYLLEPSDFAAKMYRDGILKMASVDERIEGKISVQTFKTPDELIQKLNETRCDLLMIELKSQELDGVSVLEDLHERYHGEIPVFAISKPFERDRDIAIGAGATAFLNKPLQMRTLFNTIAVCLGLEDA